MRNVGLALAELLKVLAVDVFFNDAEYCVMGIIFHHSQHKISLLLARTATNTRNKVW